jgi:hypothetical protein
MIPEAIQGIQPTVDAVPDFRVDLVVFVYFLDHNASFVQLGLEWRGLVKFQPLLGTLGPAFLSSPFISYPQFTSKSSFCKGGF